MIVEVVSPVAEAARLGLSATPKTLSPWLFYDERGSQLFEEITALPEYYLTRTERGLFELHADEMIGFAGCRVTLAELGAGTATKTGILLAAATRAQQTVLYQPIDVSPSALAEAAANLEEKVAGVVVSSQVANYITEPITLERPQEDTAILALYIGSSIGNFSPVEARAILGNLRGQLRPGDALLLGTDLAPGAAKTVERLLAAYDDAAGVTAAFNLNVLTRLNRELGANFNLDCFRHKAIWNAAESRMEMHLVSEHAQTVTIQGQRFSFTAGETIHTENSYKFNRQMIAALLAPSGFQAAKTFTDPDDLFAVTLAVAR